MCLASTNGEIEHWLFTLLLKQEFSLILGRSCKTHFNGDINFIEYLVFSILLNQQYYKSAFAVLYFHVILSCLFVDFLITVQVFDNQIQCILMCCMMLLFRHFQSSLNKTRSILFFLNIIHFVWFTFNTIWIVWINRFVNDNSYLIFRKCVKNALLKMNGLLPIPVEPL